MSQDAPETVLDNRVFYYNDICLKALIYYYVWYVLRCLVIHFTLTLLLELSERSMSKDAEGDEVEEEEPRSPV